MSVVWMAEVGQAKVIIIDNQGIARTQSPTNKNYALELPTFGAIVGVSQTEVQWNGLILEEPPSWSRFTSVPGKYAVWRRQTELSLSVLKVFFGQYGNPVQIMFKEKGWISKIYESGYFRRAADRQSLTGAIPLLTHTETLGCWVSPLAHSAPP